MKTKSDYAQDKLCRELGKEYRIRYVDWVRCIYRDFGNGFNVEVSGTHTTSKHKKALIFLWYGNEYTITCIREVLFSEIGNVVDRSTITLVSCTVPVQSRKKTCVSLDTLVPRFDADTPRGSKSLRL